MDFSALIMQIDNILWATPLIILTFGLALIYLLYCNQIRQRHKY